MSGQKIPKPYRRYIDAAVDAGWVLDFTGKGHPRLVPPRGMVDRFRGGLAAPITMSLTPSDCRSHLYLAADLKKHGIVPKEDR